MLSKRIAMLRWIIQTMLCSGLASLFVLYHPLNSLFQNSSIWVVQASVTSIDDTVGASVNRCFERIMGTCIGGVLGYLLYVSITFILKETSPLIVTILFGILMFLWPLPWAYIRQKYPDNPIIATYGTFTGYLVILSSFLRGGPHSIVITRVCTVCIGIILTTFIVMFVWPSSAHDKLDKDLCEVMECFSDLLRPLVAFEHKRTLIYNESSKEIETSYHENLVTISNQRTKIYERKDQNTFKHEEQQLLESPFYEALQDTFDVQRFYTNLNNTHYTSDTSKTYKLYEKLSSHLPSSSKKVIFYNKPFTSSDTLAVPTYRTSELQFCFTDTSSKVSYDEENKIKKLNSCHAKNVRNTSKHTVDLIWKYALATLLTSFNITGTLNKLECHTRCNEALRKIHRCQTIFSNVPKLILACKKEYPFCCHLNTGLFKKFPDTIYLNLVKHIQELFHHIASLFFQLNAEQKIPFLGKFLESTWSSADSTIASIFSNITSLNSINSNGLLAGLAGSLFFHEMFGSFIYKIVETICKALNQLSFCLLHRSNTLEAKKSIDMAMQIIQSLQRLRKERQMIYKQVFTTAASSCVTSLQQNSSTSSIIHQKNEHFFPSESRIQWDILMGIDLKTFQQMTHEDHQLYWTSFWYTRDRLSIVISTLIRLPYKLYSILDVVNEIIAY